MRPKHLVAAPLFVWSTIGVILLVDGAHALDYFPYFWFANDIAIVVALIGLFMHLLAGPPSEGPRMDEWTGFDPQGDADAPLEEMLVRLARRAEEEAGRP